MLPITVVEINVIGYEKRFRKYCASDPRRLVQGASDPRRLVQGALGAR